MNKETQTRFPEANYIDPGLPEYAENPCIAALPPIMDEYSVVKLLTQRPSISEVEKSLPGHIRVHAISRLTKNFFQPLTTHLHLERKLSLLIRQGYLGRNPKYPDFKKHLNNCYQKIIKQDLEAYVHDDVDSTASSMSVVGISGTGKSTTFNIILKTYPKVIYHPDYNLIQIPWIKVDCPHDGTLTEFCYRFFMALDRRLNTNYRQKIGSGRPSIGKLIAELANLCLIHAVGLLVIDEFQHMNLAKSGGEKKMINFLVTLVNTIGVSVILVGTPKALPIFAGEFRQARRASGEGSIVWNRMPYDESWDDFIDEMWSFQWLRNRQPLNEAIRNKLYELSQGIADIVVKLFCLAQARSILLAQSSDDEFISVELLEDVFEEEFSTVGPMLEALRENNERKLRECADLVLPDIEGKLLNTFDHLKKQRVTKPIIVETGDAEESGLATSALKALTAMGINQDIALPLIAESIQNNPNLTLIQVVHAVTSLMTITGHEQKPKNNRPKMVLVKSSNWGQLNEDDLRKVHFVKTATMYESLVESGFIYPVENLLAG